MFILYVPSLFVCFDKVVTLALIFFTKKRKWSQLKVRGRNALNTQNKEVYKCIIFQESWLKACHFSDIDEWARNLSCHVNANCTNTIGSHVCTCHTGYTGDGQTCSGDVDNFPSMSRKVLYDQRERQPPLLLFLHIQSQLLKAGDNLKRLFSSNYKARSSQSFILKFIPH